MFDYSFTLSHTARSLCWFELALAQLALFAVFQYNELYQKVKQYSKDGENFFKELMAVFQQR